MSNLALPNILKNAEFLKLWGNQILLQVSINICNYAAILIIAHRTHSVFAQAEFYAALTIPAFLVSLIAGPMIDIVDRKRIMLIANFSLVLLFLSYVLGNNSLIVIMMVAFSTSIAARFFIPAEIATIPLIVDKKDIEQANAFFLFTLMGSVLLGYSLTGPIMQVFGGLGTKGELAPFIVSSIIVAIGFLLIFKLKKADYIKAAIPSGSFLKKALHLSMQTMKAIKKDNKISLPILLLVFVELIVGILSVALLEYIRRYLNLPLTSASLILIIPLIVGLLFGGLMLKKVEKKYGRRLSIYLSCVGIGILFLVLGGVPLIGQNLLFLFRFITMVSAFSFGVLIVVISVQSRTVLQTHTKIQMQGRVFSILDIMIAVFTPIPVLLLGFFADSISILAALIFMGIIIIAVTVFGNSVIVKRL